MPKLTPEQEKRFDELTHDIGDNHSQDCCVYWHKVKVPEIKAFLASELEAQRTAAAKLVEDHYEPINGKYHLIAQIKSL